MTALQTLDNAHVITTSGPSTQAQQVPTEIINQVAIEVNVTAVSGTTPSLTAAVQWSADGVTYVPAVPADTFTAVTSVGATVQVFSVKGPFYRIQYTVSGTTPSFTVTTTGFFV